MARNRRTRRRYGTRRRTKTRSRMVRKMPRTRSRKYRRGGVSRTGKLKRWQKFTFTRMTDLQWQNADPALGAPEIQVASFSTQQPTVIGNLVTPLVLDTTAPRAANCSNWSAAFIFKMNNLPGMSEFFATGLPPSGLFEEYRLRKVILEFVPVYAGKDIVAATSFTGIPVTDDGYTSQRSYPTPTLYYVRDHDSVNSLNWPMIVQMGGVNKVKLNRNVRIALTPNTVMPVAQSLAGGSVFSSLKKSPWITNNNLNIEHYGFRFFVQDWPGPSDGVGAEGDAIDFQLRVNMTYVFDVRGVI